MKKLSNALFVGAITITLGFDLYMAGDLVYKDIKHKSIFKDIDEDRFIKNKQNKAIYLPISNKGIDVLIEDNFTKEQKDIIADAINDCDHKFTNIEYNIPR